MVHKLGGLLGHCHVFWTVRYKFNRLCCAEEDTHQARLHRTYSIPYLCSYNFAAAILVSKVNFAIVIALRLNSIMADLALNKVYRVCNCALDNAFNFTT